MWHNANSRHFTFHGMIIWAIDDDISIRCFLNNRRRPIEGFLTDFEV